MSAATEKQVNLTRLRGLKAWADYLVDKELPMFMHTAEMLAALNEDIGIPMDRVCFSVLQDPGASLALLRMANSLKRGRLGAEVTTLETAAMMLGLRRLRDLPSGHALVRPDAESLRQKWYMRLASRNYLAASFAYDWALIRGDMMPKEVFVATFLHNVAGMMLWVHAEDIMWHINALIYQENMSVDEAQYIVLGFSLDDLSAELARRWHLPELVYESLDPENIQNHRMLSVRLAIQLGRITEHGWYGENLEHCLESVADMLGNHVDSLAPRVKRVAVVAAHETDFYGVRPCAALLPMLPGKDEPEKFPEKWANIGQVATEEEVSSRKQEAIDAREQPQQQEQDVSHAGICLMPDNHAFQLAAHRLMNEHDTLNSLHDIMTEVLKGLHDGIGLNRVVFAMSSRDGLLLKSRFLSGVENDSVFSHFVLHMDGKNLFSRIMKKQQSIWVNADNRKKFWPLVPPHFATMINVEEFFCMSVVVHGKPIGMFYADRHSIDCTLDEHSYKRFKQMVGLASKTIEKMQDRK